LYFLLVSFGGVFLFTGFLTGGKYFSLNSLLLKSEEEHSLSSRQIILNKDKIITHIYVILTINNENSLARLILFSRFTRDRCICLHDLIFRVRLYKRTYTHTDYSSTVISTPST